MFNNYIKIAWRNLLKNKVYSIINIGGLAVGMAVAIVIGLWIWDEITFDKYHENYDDIAQIRYSNYDASSNTIGGSDGIPYPLGTEIKNAYSQHFKHILMAWWLGDYSLSFDGKKITTKGEFIEPGVIDMLSLKMLSGSNTSLNDPHSIILSQEKASAIFGSENPINKTLKIDNNIEVNVTGVYEDLPENGKFGGVQFFAPWSLWVSSNEWINASADDWNNSSFNVYVQKNSNVSYDLVNTAIKDIYYKPIVRTDINDKKEAYLYPMSQWHLYSDFKDGRPAGGRITFVYLFGIVCFFVLFLACINFMNLSTARSEKRGKEVGIRKAIGSPKSSLIFQFLGESFLVVIMAFVLAISLVFVLFPKFNELADKHLSIPFENPIFWISIISFIMLTGFLAGLYPAFYLSSFQPIKVLKGTLRSGRFASSPRKILVVTQFTISIALIIGTSIVYQQIQYSIDRPVGYESEGLVTVPMNDPAYKGQQDLIKRELISAGLVTSMAFSSNTLTKTNRHLSDFSWEGKNTGERSSFACVDVTYDFGKTVGWEFLDGRDFSESSSTDYDAIIINETAAKYMNFKNPIGKYIKTKEGTQLLQIVGVIKDVVMDSPYEPVKRGIFFIDKNYVASKQIIFKIKPSVSAASTLSKIETVFKNVVPSASFDYKFVDDLYANKFGQEQRIGKISTLFTILAILISCLGLFGLSSFIAEQRTKEIGLRKVLGANVANLWALLSKDFVLLVIISILIASPIAYYFMNEWIQKYTYRTDISWWIFLAAGAGALTITVITVSYQTLKACLMNPVKSLRSE